MKYLLTAFCALLLFSCSDKDLPYSEVSAERTVIVYISAENGLAGFAQSDLNELIEASRHITKDQRLVVFYDDNNKTEPPYIALLKNGEVIKDTKLSFKEDFYSSDPEKMKLILSHIMHNYWADDFVLDLWGHGSGWVITNDTIEGGQPASKTMSRAFGIDNGQNTTMDTGKWINITQMANIFNSLPARFRLIYGNNCFFQCIETAYELKDCTDYLMGAPAELPAETASYIDMIPLMFNKDIEFYKAIADKQYEECRYLDCTPPMSVIYTGNLERLAKATSKLMPDIMKNDNFTGHRIITYGPLQDDSGRKAKGYYDMKNIVMEYAADNDAYREWKLAFDETVVYRLKSNKWETIFPAYINFSAFDVNDDTYGGVSMFIPQPMYNILSPCPNKTIQQMKWANAVGL
ncbi:MAG: clostripain-related cysteine peptidase [Prevotella sp.]|nr:clostripain-related cysteine peptidase [Prevotella sp.]